MAKTRIGVLTGGGDCPGLNTVIRGVAKTAMSRYGYEVVGFLDGYSGLLRRNYVDLTDDKVSGILTQGGTILGSSNKDDPFSHWTEKDGVRTNVNLSGQCMDLYNELGLSGLICIGGDGTMAVAQKFSKIGMKIVGVPKTIDNDLVGTDYTFGFDSAFTTATEAIDKIHTTAAAHKRVMFVEVMGRNAGWLALESGVAGGADVILIPEIPYDFDEITHAIQTRHERGKKFSIVVVAEGARPVGGAQTYSRLVQDSPDPIRLGGCSHVIAHEIEKRTGFECRVAVLGHLQRGGSPTPRDRVLATRFAVQAVDYFAEGRYDHIVMLQGNALVPVPLSEVAGKQRLVPRDFPLIKTAEGVGTSFGAKL